MTKPLYTADWQIEWEDSGREPRCQPNPRYPDGIDIDISDGGEPTCTAALVYPARRIGHYRVRCRTCGASCTLTTAGRPDDPRSLTMACKRMLQ